MAKQGGDNSRRKKEEPQDEFEEKVLYINRCAKVLKGGRRFSFSALIIVGDGKGRVGFGFAKANELTDAIRKGGENARKNLITFEMDGNTIPHEIVAEHDGAKLLLKPAQEGTGVVAGSKPRVILELAGVKDVVAKSLGSSNPLNQVKATFNALLALRNKEECLKIRGLA